MFVLLVLHQGTVEGWIIELLIGRCYNAL